MSVRESTALPRACSGDIYATVPITVPACVSPGFLCQLLYRVAQLRQVLRGQVQYLDDTVPPNHYVFGLDVTVNDVYGMSSGKRLRRLHDDIHRIRQ